MGYVYAILECLAGGSQADDGQSKVLEAVEMYARNTNV